MTEHLTLSGIIRRYIDDPTQQTKEFTITHAPEGTGVFLVYVHRCGFNDLNMVLNHIRPPAIKTHIGDEDILELADIPRIRNPKYREIFTRRVLRKGYKTLIRTLESWLIMHGKRTSLPKDIHPRDLARRLVTSKVIEIERNEHNACYLGWDYQTHHDILVEEGLPDMDERTLDKTLRTLITHDLRKERVYRMVINTIETQYYLLPLNVNLVPDTPYRNPNTPVIYVRFYYDPASECGMVDVGRSAGIVREVFATSPFFRGVYINEEHPESSSNDRYREICCQATANTIVSSFLGLLDVHWSKNPSDTEHLAYIVRHDGDIPRSAYSWANE